MQKISILEHPQSSVQKSSETEKIKVRKKVPRNGKKQGGKYSKLKT